MAWVNKYGVKVYMGEYGVLNTANYADKLAWLTDVGQIVTDLNLAAALWCYNPGFSILENPKAPTGQRNFDSKLLKTFQLNE